MFPNEEYMKTVLHGVGNKFGDVSNRLDDLKNKAIQPDYQQNDPTAPDYIKNRVGGYDISKTIEMSAEWVNQTVNDIITSPEIALGGGEVIFYMCLVTEDITGLENAIKNDTVVLKGDNYYEKIVAGKTWNAFDNGYVIGEDYKEGDMILPGAIAILKENTTYGGITYPKCGVYISGARSKGNSRVGSKGFSSISWTYIETEPVKIPQKYLPDPEPKNTLVVKFTLISSTPFACEANYSIDEIREAYASGKVIIKGALLDGEKTGLDATCEVNDTCVCFKFEQNGATVYILMNANGEKNGYVFPDSEMFHFESDSQFSLKVTTPGWDGKIYATGQEWNGSQVQSLYFDGKYRLYLYGKGNGKLTGQGRNHEFVLTGSNIHAKGSIEALRDISGNTNMLGYCYSGMFSGCTSLVKAPELPATTLAGNCYEYMFFQCTSLVKAPELPATTLAKRCYDVMFASCSALVEAPKLPATTLAGNCYSGMFSGCTSLVKAPELPATTLAEFCYNNMFGACSALVEAPKLPATTLAKGCYNNMFGFCSSLTKIPELPATTLAEGCYYYLFGYNQSLKLSATKTDDYYIEYRIPSSGTGVTVDSTFGMFTSTGGTFTGTPTINTTYYLHKSCGIVGMTDDPKPVPKTDEMTQPVGMDKWTGELFTKPSEGGGGASIDLGITGATVGQIAKITAVDASGKPTAWEPADLPGGESSGETWELIQSTTLEEDTASIVYSTDVNGNPFKLKKMQLIITGVASDVRLDTSIGLDKKRSFPIYDYNFFPKSQTKNNPNIVGHVTYCEKKAYDPLIKYRSYSKFLSTQLYQIAGNEFGGAFFYTPDLYPYEYIQLSPHNNGVFFAGCKIELYGVRA